MSGVNKVIILGFLGKDPDFRYLPNGGGVANVSIATSESWKDKQTGEQKEKTEWHKVVLFGKLAEIAEKYLKKGSKVYIEGALQTRKWQNQQGQDQYTTEIVVKGFDGIMQMLDSKPSNQATSSQSQPTPEHIVVNKHPNGMLKTQAEIDTEVKKYKELGYTVKPGW